MSSSQDSMVQLKVWWEDVPIFAKFIAFLITTLYILSWFTFYPLVNLLLIPFYVIYQQYWWEVLTFQYQHPKIIMLIFALWSYLPTASKTERVMGTVKYISYFLIMNIIIGAVHVVLMFALFETGLSLFQGCLYVPSYGLWPLILSNMVVRCNQNPDNLIQFLCFPCKFKQKYYPWIFFLAFSLLFELVMWNLLVGIIAGYLSNFYLDLYGVLDFAYFSDKMAERVERICCRCCLRFEGFIEMRYAGNELPGRAPTLIARSNGVSVSSVRPFIGQGYRLGGDAPNSARLMDPFEMTSK